jgi:pectin methylesterase-like acyl-CoA thioesterase
LHDMQFNSSSPLNLKVGFTLLKRPSQVLGNEEFLNSTTTMEIMSARTGVLIGALSCCISVAAILLSPAARLHHPPTSNLRAAVPDLAAPSLSSHSHQNASISDDEYNPACDDFPPDFPPPDTAAVSVFCVDQNGCCDFTTVQEAVDAVPSSSKKRSVVWINKGIYL